MIRLVAGQIWIYEGSKRKELGGGNRIREVEGESRKLTKHNISFIHKAYHTISKRVLFIDQGQGHFGLTKKHLERP